MNKKRLIARRGGRCIACGATENLCLDHIISKSNGGKDKPSNLQVLCCSCNSAKGNKTINFKTTDNKAFAFRKNNLTCAQCHLANVRFRFKTDTFVCNRCGFEWDKPTN